MIMTGVILDSICTVEQLYGELKMSNEDNEYPNSVGKRIADLLGQTQTADIFKWMGEAILAARDDFDFDIGSMRKASIMPYSKTELTQIIENDIYTISLSKLVEIQKNLLVLQESYNSIFDQHQEKLDEISKRTNALRDKIQRLTGEATEEKSCSKIENLSFNKTVDEKICQKENSLSVNTVEEQRIGFDYAIFEILLPTVMKAINKMRSENSSLQ